MKITKHTAAFSFAALVATSLLAPHLDAQMGQKSRSIVHRIGNSVAALDAVGWARSQSYSGRPRVDTVISKRINFLGYRGELSRLAVTAGRTGSLGFHGSYILKVLGVTRKVGSMTGSGTARFTNNTWAFSSAPSHTFLVGGFVPVTVAGNIGHGAAMNTRYINFLSSTRGVGVSGSTETYATGFAEAGIGIRGFQAGVNATLRLGQQRFNGYLAAFTNYLSTGYHGYSLTPVRLLINLFAEFLWWRGDLNVVDVSFLKRSYAPFIR